jgi:RHS repeat-associated protein
VKARDYSGNERTNTYEVSVSGSTKTFTFDANGNMADDGTRTFEWDAENRLLSVKEGTIVNASFVYDGDGRRHQKSASGVTRTYVYDGVQIAEERLSTGGTIRYWYGREIDDVIAKQDTVGEAFFYTKDHLGSIRQVTNNLGATVVSRDYDPWGGLLAGSTTSGYAFTGREWDPEAKLYHYRARYYNSKLGRFVSQDPSGLSGGLNLYVYADNIPTSMVDPFGLSPTTRRGAGVGGVMRIIRLCDPYQYRNSFNRCPTSEPSGDPSWSRDSSVLTSILRFFGGSGTPKYRGPDGSECAYDGCGNLLPDDGNNYTYNYEPDSMTWNHIRYDVLPTFYCGSHKPNLTTTY